MIVTGGAGFIGSHAAEYFSDKGWKVVAVDNLSRGKMLGVSGTDTSAYNWSYLSKRGGIELVKASVNDENRMNELISDADAVLHTAGQVAVTTSLKDPRKDFETNMLGTFNVLEACRKSGRNPAVLFCSTNKVYGENVNSIEVELSGNRYRYAGSMYEKGIPEHFSVDGCEHTPYGASKLAADLYVQEYGHTYGLKTGVFRMSCIYGTRQFGNEDQGWVAHFLLSALRNREITIYGDGRQVRDVLYVTDLVRAYDAFLRSDLKFGLFNMGGGAQNTISLLELLDHIEEMTGIKPVIRFDRWRNGDQRVYISNISRAAGQLGWEPSVDIVQGLLNMLKWAKNETSPDQ
jgi:CDP-paratose 2-epimerase